jgi:hypothetical protein
VLGKLVDSGEGVADFCGIRIVEFIIVFHDKRIDYPKISN